MDRPIKKRFWNRRRISYAATGAVILFLMVYALFSAGGGSTLRVEADKMTISEVAYGDFLEFIPVNGTAEPIKTFYLDATSGGMVVEVYLEEDSYVKIGDSILLLDNTDLHLDMMYREAQLFEQINNLRNTRLAMEQNSLRLRADLLDIDRQIITARRDYDQAVQLKEKNLISDNQFDQAKETFDYWNLKRELTIETQRQDSILRTIQIEQLEASVVRMENNLDVVRKKLEDLVLRAPIAGQLTSLNAEVGESKSRGERLGQIDVLDGFKISAPVDEYYISRVHKGLAGEVKIAGETYPLRVTKVYTEVRDGRFQIDLEFVNREPPDVRRGQTMKISLALGDLAQATILARGSFYQSTGGNWVYVVDQSGSFATKRQISIGRMNPLVYEVLEGLELGEKVVTSSYDNFEDYDKLVFKDR